jgi:hypothetical protein
LSGCDQALRPLIAERAGLRLVKGVMAGSAANAADWQILSDGSAATTQSADRSKRMICRVASRIDARTQIVSGLRRRRAVRSLKNRSQ